MNVRGKAERKGSRERQLDQRKAWLEQEKIMATKGERENESKCVLSLAQLPSRKR